MDRDFGDLMDRVFLKWKRQGGNVKDRESVKDFFDKWRLEIERESADAVADENWELALEDARDSVKSGKLPRTGAEVILYWWRLLGPSPEAQARIIRHHLEKSRAFRSSWDALVLIAQDLLCDGKPLPPELAKWLAGALASVLPDLGANSKAKPPPRPRGGTEPNAGRNQEIRWMVADLAQRYCLTRTRSTTGNIDRFPNEQDPLECCREGGSACDAVGIAMGIKKYRTVQDIYFESTNTFPPIG